MRQSRPQLFMMVWGVVDRTQDVVRTKNQVNILNTIFAMCSVPPSGISIVREARTVFMVVINNWYGGPGREGK